MDIVSRFREIYDLSNIITIDKYMCPFQGRFRYHVLEPNKPIKFGIKLINDCDGSTRYCLGITPYLGREFYLQKSDITNLDELILNKGSRYTNSKCHFYLDNYYCHPELAGKVKSLGHEMTGTVRFSRKDVTNKFTVCKVNVETSKGFFHKDGVYLLRYRDKRGINILTTCDSLALKEYTSTRKRKKIKPVAVSNLHSEDERSE